MKLKLVTIALCCMAISMQAQENIHYQWMDSYYRNVATGAPLTLNPRRVAVPGIPGYNAYKADLHMHTVYSDGSVTPQMRVTEAVMEDLDVLAITDHIPIPRSGFGDNDLNSSVNAAIPDAKELGLKIIRGLEITGNEPVGHLNVLFVKDVNNYRLAKGFTTADCDAVLEKAVSEGAFVTTNHPGWPDQNSDLSDYIIERINNGTIKGIEIFNSKEFYPMAIDHALRYNLAMLGCTDSHYPTYYSFDQENNHRDMTIIFAKDKSDEALKEALTAGRTIAWADNKLAGREDLMLEFFRSCIKVEKYVDMGKYVRFRLLNTSDIPFYLTNDRDPRESIMIPANGYAETKRSKEDLSLCFKVMNTYITSTEHLELTLSSLLSDNEISSPFVKPKSIAFSDSGLDFSITTGTGETYYTLDGSQPGPQSTLYDGGTIHLDGTATLRAITIRDGKSSDEYLHSFAVSMASKAKAKKNGVHFKYFENDGILSTKDIETIGVLKAEGTKADLNISEGIDKDHFGYIFSGVIKVPETGVYIFTLTTNDGSDLFFGDTLACDNDQHEGQKTANGKVYLQKGCHPFHIRYFEGYGSECFFLKWQTPSSSVAVDVPADVLFLE